jgi:phosphatidate cytidylyltransferase
MFFSVAFLLLAAWLPHFSQEPQHHLDLTPLSLAYCFALMLLCAIEAWRFQQAGTSLETLATEIFIVSYVGFLLAMTAQLRWVAGTSAGYLAIGSVVLCAKGGDIGAYFFGKRFGRHKLAPLLSPAKTWEGAIGALLGSALCAWLWLFFATPMFIAGASPAAWYWCLFYGAAIGLVGMIGDLCESLIKRDVRRKDSSALFPGFGGLLDMLDSVLYAGPAALLLWKTLPLATWLN